MNEDRRRRIDRIKKALPKVVLAMILIPTVLCLILGGMLIRTRGELRVAGERVADLEKKLAASVSKNGTDRVVEIGESGVPVDRDEPLPASRFDMARLMEENDPSSSDEPYCIYLTFDDGPSENTDRILAILREYDVKASFFVNGRTDEESLMLYEQIARAGHTLGMHSYSHKYSQVYRSQDAFREDMERIRTLIYDTTGVEPVYYRFPGGSSTNAASQTSMRNFIDILHENGIEYIDWNIDSGDSEAQDVSADRIVGNVFKNFGRYRENVVLLHDGPGHQATVEALPEIIERARNMGALLLPITDDTVPVQHLGNR